MHATRLTHPVDASLDHPFFAARKEGNYIRLFYIFGHDISNRIMQAVKARTNTGRSSSMGISSKQKYKTA